MSAQKAGKQETKQETLSVEFERRLYGCERQAEEIAERAQRIWVALSGQQPEDWTEQEAMPNRDGLLGRSLDRLDRITDRHLLAWSFLGQAMCELGIETDGCFPASQGS